MGKGEAQRPPFDPVSCSYDPADPYEPRALWKGALGGMSGYGKRRPVRILHMSGETTLVLVLANVYHDGGYRSSIPTMRCTTCIFAGVLSCDCTRWAPRPVSSFSSPCVSWGKVPESGERSMSTSGSCRSGSSGRDSYDLVKESGPFGLALRVTFLQRYESMVVEQGHHVEQWSLTEQEKADFLPFYAAESEALGLEETYHTLFETHKRNWCAIWTEGCTTHGEST